jgi:cytochrome c oxidase subunit 2
VERIPTIPFIPPQASSVAGPIDLLFLGYTIICAFFGVGICIAIVYLGVKYRRGTKVDRSNPPLYNTGIEIVWTFGPAVLLIVMFAWATGIYLFVKRPPDNAIQINVVGKQWMWKIQHPEGRWEMNELHVPVGRPIELIMTSEDVIHDWFVPAFRVHQDVIPGEYVNTWFTPTQVGTYHLFCAQFCGTFHSQMTGEVTVMDPADYQRWLATGTYTQTLAAQGAVLFREHGCSGCHGAGSSVRAPTLEGLFGHPIPVQIVPQGTPATQLRAVLAKTPATTIIADDKYIHDCIMLQTQIPAGFEPIMPVFKGQLSEQEVFQLTAYIKSLATKRTVTTGTPAGKYTGTLTPEEYRARTGFIPANIKALTGQPPSSAPMGGAPTSTPTTSSPQNNDNVFGNSSTNQGRTSP